MRAVTGPTRRAIALTIGIVFACGVIVAAEGVCRRAFPPDGDVDYPDLMTADAGPLDWALRPGVAVRLGHWPVVRTNALGFRHPGEIATPKPSGTFRVFLLGGSGAFALGISDTCTIAARIEQFLRAGGNARVEVICAAVPGYMAQQELQMLVHRVLPLEPDAILVLDGHNDMGAAANPEYVLTPSGWRTRMAATAEERRTLLFGSLLRFDLADAAARSGLFRAARSLSRRWRPPPEAQEARTPDSAALAHYEGTLRGMARRTRAAGAEIVFMAQPNLYYGRGRMTRMEAIHLAAAARHYGPAIPVLERFTPVYAEAMRRAAEAEGARFLDLTSAFRDEEKFNCFYDGVHLTPYGAMHLAWKIVEAGLGGITVPPPKSASGTGADG